MSSQQRESQDGSSGAGSSGSHHHISALASIDSFDSKWYFRKFSISGCDFEKENVGMNNILCASRTYVLFYKPQRERLVLIESDIDGCFDRLVDRQ